MIEHHDSVAGDPCIGLEAGCAQALGKQKCFEGVLGRVRASAPMGETDGGIEE